MREAGRGASKRDRSGHSLQPAARRSGSRCLAGALSSARPGAPLTSLRFVAAITTVRLLASKPSRCRRRTPRTRRVASCMSAWGGRQRRGKRGRAWEASRHGRRSGAASRRSGRAGQARMASHRSPLEREVARASTSSKKTTHPSGKLSHACSMSAAAGGEAEGGSRRGGCGDRWPRLARQRARVAAPQASRHGHRPASCFSDSPYHLLRQQSAKGESTVR